MESLCVEAVQRRLDRNLALQQLTAMLSQESEPIDERDCDALLQVAGLHQRRLVELAPIPIFAPMMCPGVLLVVFERGCFCLFARAKVPVPAADFFGDSVFVKCVRTKNKAIFVSQRSLTLVDLTTTQAKHIQTSRVGAWGGNWDVVPVYAEGQLTDKFACLQLDASGKRRIILSDGVETELLRDPAFTNVIKLASSAAGLALLSSARGDDDYDDGATLHVLVLNWDWDPLFEAELKTEVGFWDEHVRFEWFPDYGPRLVDQLVVLLPDDEKQELTWLQFGQAVKAWHGKSSGHIKCGSTGLLKYDGERLAVLDPDTKDFGPWVKLAT
jgi:hypothetical protein